MNEELLAGLSKNPDKKEVKTKKSIRQLDIDETIRNLELYYDKNEQKLFLRVERVKDNIIELILYEFNKDDYWYIPKMVKINDKLVDVVILKDSTLRLLLDLLKKYCYINVRVKNITDRYIVCEGVFMKFKRPLSIEEAMILYNFDKYFDKLKETKLDNIIERIDIIERVEEISVKDRKNMQNAINRAITKTSAKLLRKNLGLPIGLIVE